jgi:hypothetical protein
MLKFPLNQKQVEAANDLHDTVDLWQSTDRMWPKLKEAMPGWGVEESIVKCTLVDRLYSTNVFAIERMAQHVKEVFEMQPKLDEQLVALIAQRKAPKGKKPRSEISFASKLCHLFVSDSLPIYDSAAREMLQMHLGDLYNEDKATPYKSFCENLRVLCEEAGLQSECRRLDRYLWIAGLYRRKQQGRKINAELGRIVENPTTDQIEALAILFPRDFKRYAA